MKLKGRCYPRETAGAVWHRLHVIGAISVFHISIVTTEIFAQCRQLLLHGNTMWVWSLKTTFDFLKPPSSLCRNFCQSRTIITAMWEIHQKPQTALKTSLTALVQHEGQGLGDAEGSSRTLSSCFASQQQHCSAGPQPQQGSAQMVTATSGKARAAPSTLFQSERSHQVTQEFFFYQIPAP